MARPRTALDPWNIGFGAIALVLALASLLLWFPNDIGSGFLVSNRAGIREPGDAFFPVLLAWTLLLLSVVQLSGALTEKFRQATGGKLTWANLRFLVLLYAIIFAALALMYWLGPVVTGALRHAGIIDQTYRELVDTAPYKYIGYLAGGFLMTLGLISWAEGKLRLRTLLTVVLVLASLVLIFDVSLRNVPLPPNLDY